MQRCLKQGYLIPRSGLDCSRLIHSLIGLDVPSSSFSNQDEDISLLTTIHQAVVLQMNCTQPMPTLKMKTKENTQ
jgi:hypothetical protein